MQQRQASIGKPALPTAHSPRRHLLDLVFEMFALTRPPAITATCCTERNFQSADVLKLDATFLIDSL
jgi:hypothetical protein